MPIPRRRTMLKWIEIDKKVITENVRIIKAALKKGVKFTAVVKANGYGHGACETAEAAIIGGADSLAVLTAEEGLKLRKAFPDAKIKLLAPSLPEEAEAIAAGKLEPCPDSIDFLLAFEKAAKKHKGKSGFLPWTLPADTGMGRWGIAPEAFASFLKEATDTDKFQHIRLAGISTHLGYKPPQNMTDAEEKLKLFAKLAEQASSAAGRHIEACAANSSVFCDFPDSQHDEVRIGNLMYGIYPTDIYRKRRQGPPLPGLLRPWKFFAKIISVKQIRKGQKLGYNAEFTAPKDMRIAAIPAGYSDGLTMEPAEYQIRISSGFRYWGVINNKKAFFISKPGISHTLLDVSEIPEAIPGTAVSLHVRRTAANTLIPKIYV